MDVSFRLYTGKTYTDEKSGEVCYAPIEPKPLLQALIIGRLQQAFETIRPHLPNMPGRHVSVSAYNASYRPENILGGVCFRGNVEMGFNPAHPEFLPRLQHTAELELVLAHEMHHAVRGALKQGFRTIGDRVVTEGLAEVFSREVVGPRVPPVPTSISLLTEHRAQRLLPLLGKCKEGVPVWKDNEITDRVMKAVDRDKYRLGINVVHRYQDKMQQETGHRPSAMDLVAAPAEQILAATFG